LLPLKDQSQLAQKEGTFPRQISPEFMLVDLVNELDQRAIDQDAVLSRFREKTKERTRENFRGQH
jgi:hypothetical protein